jgi:PleD family two-component response regulator
MGTVIAAPDEGSDSLLQRADEMMYESKRGRRRA